MLKSNQHYFDISVKNKETLEDCYMVLSKDKHINDYANVIQKIKELLYTIKTLEAKKNNADDFYFDLYKVISYKYADKSELVCFFNACDCTINTIKEQFDTFKKVVSLYLNNRDITDITPKEWIQALIDKGASRSKGSIGEKKLEKIANKHGFVSVNNWEDFLKTKKAVVRFRKNKFDVKTIKKHLGVNLNFNTQNKMLDIILKSGTNYCFIEAKHLKEGGGSQDKQIKELIEIISQKIKNNHIFLGAFMDGVYSNILLDGINNKLFKNPYCLLKENKSDKLKNQRYDIVQSLQNCENSFWFNTSGFDKFLCDF